MILLGVAACANPVPTTALFAIPGGSTADDFYALPFPSDLRRHDDGSLDLSQFPTASLLFEQYRVEIEKLDGFGLNQAIFARFDGALDPASLPGPAASIEANASVYLVNVDPASPDRGVRSPLIVTFRGAAGATIGANNLVARPYPGFGLADGTTYALVITNRVRGARGGSVEPSADLVALLGDAADAPTLRAREVYAPLLDYLDEPGGDERSDVVSAAVFTTQHATNIVPALRKAVFAAPAPIAANIVASTVITDFKEFTGTYLAPNFQTGTVPYQHPPDGEIKIGSDGAAVIARTETMRFALTVPPGPTPATGWPICIYAHGTGGDYRSFIEDGTATRLAQQGIVVISTDQVLHGPRNPGGDAELDFFNFGNPYAARDNALQGTADAFAQLRLALGLAIHDGARTITVDPERVYFFGHSQGGVTGPGFVAFEPSLTGAVLSGTGGLLYINLLHKTNPLDIPSLVEAALRETPLDENSPSLALLQMWVERADGANYAPMMVRKPATGPDGTRLAPRNIFQTEGFTDTYSPNLGIEAFATALGGDLVQLPDEKAVDGLTLRNRTVMSVPFTGNLNGATAVLAQYKQRSGSDGHFVVFDIAAAGQQSSEFLGTLARTGKATVVAPH